MLHVLTVTLFATACFFSACFGTGVGIWQQSKHRMGKDHRQTRTWSNVVATFVLFTLTAFTTGCVCLYWTSL